ncbi:ABC transporter substrate-binding protein [Pseudaeromonas paramecii]|uniref:ABC transporter substrate-binding protein n=1 Tax=Pseudaeromonas paramecii TaxID=2138166 RepID=A0ABP8Q8V6_9GAMM
MLRRVIGYPLLALSLVVLAGLVQAAPTQVEDVLGRKVTLELPAKRIVLGFYPEDYLAVGSEQAADRLVGMSLGWFVKSRPATWALYVAQQPQLAKVPDLGNVQDQSFSIEKTLAVRPDVVILADWQYQALAPDLPRLAQAGIPVVVIDYNAQTLARHLASTRILGELTGQAQRAQQMAEEYRQVVETITSRIAQAKQPKPRVYIELGDKGPAEYSYTYGKDMWGAMALLTGGDNVAAPFVERWGSLHPEQLLASKPDVILLAGYENVSNDQAMQIGQDISAETVRARLNGFIQRPGWADLPAVQQGRVYGVYHGATRSIMDAALLQFMAKAFYPDLFADLDPQATYLDFYRRYLPIRPQGTFMLGLAPQGAQ